MAIARITRRIDEILNARMAESPVVALQGPRSVGKSTVLRDVARRHGVGVLDLDEPAVLRLVLDDPGAFVNGPAPVCIDEYQRAPVILDAIKAQLNRATAPGRFVMTGSTRFDALPAAAQALTGRLQLLEIMPFSQGEMDGVRESFLDLAFRNPDHVRALSPSRTTRAEYIDRIVRGGMPLAVGRSVGSRQRWFESYVTSALQRDIRDLARIRQAAVLPRLLQRLAGQTAQLLNISRAAQAAGVEARTADNYVRLLEALFLVRRLPAWGRMLRAKAGAAPKVYVADSGIAAQLLRLSPAKLARRDPASQVEFGHLLESFVVGEVLKQASWNDEVAAIGHWRTRDGQEVDLVVERFDGSIVCFEIKAGSNVNRSDRSGLVALRNLVGEQFSAGYVLYTGEHGVRLEDRIYAAPVDQLWRTEC